MAAISALSGLYKERKIPGKLAGGFWFVSVRRKPWLSQILSHPSLHARQRPSAMTESILGFGW
jgi:hypothetical protein